MDDHSTIFALDIGTRSVVGIILKKKENGFEVIDLESKEHENRAMLDGQIHDVLSVSNLIQEIKEKLETKHGPLKKVCVAAAGRALKTKRAKINVEISGKPLMNEQDIFHLELSAVQKAQKELASESSHMQSVHYYCVGYSVLRYLLDKEEIGNLIDQQGEEATVEIIATFLPKVVVESLLAALQRAGLEMDALTLEPIAAIHVLIPPSMRRLNVALVDIGAGTSDIAITDEGTIIAYGMVPIAGDEITEAISDHYLLDFPLAEQAKRELHTNQVITVKDILGFETKVPKKEVVQTIMESLDKLATAISEEILTLNNHKSPKAVMLVGGGSLTPELPALLAQKLDLPKNRVAIRGIEAIQNLTISKEINKGPELVTPIGIAIAAKKSPIQYISVTVNGRVVRLFDMKKLTIGDCILAAGIEINKLYGKPGMAMIITLNGRDITIPGHHGKPPKILKNGIAVSLKDDSVQEGDHIIVEKGKDGEAAKICIKDIIENAPTMQIWVNDQPMKLEMEIYKNGQKVSINEPLKDHDRIETSYPNTIGELMKRLDNQLLHPFYVYLNQEKITLSKFHTEIYKNGVKVTMTTTIHDQDVIDIKYKNAPTVNDLLEEKGSSFFYHMPVTFNGERVILKQAAWEIYRNEEKLSENSILKRGEKLRAIQNKNESFIFQDVFRYVDIQLPVSNVKNFVILKNGEKATFHDKLAPGDELEIQWTKKESLNK